MQDPTIEPDNHTGASSDTSHEVNLPDVAAAKQFFSIVKQRLLDVNKWHQIAGSKSAGFRLFDEHGIEADREARLGDHFRIDIPGPGSVAGSGYDWVQVEAIENSSTASGEVLSIRVRPCANPQNKEAGTAHFFDEQASSTFSVLRNGSTITASVKGRNEKPNAAANKIVDKLRNSVVAAGAMLGLNKPQWHSLVKGLLASDAGKDTDG